MSNLVGTTLLTRYHVESFVGRGGMAEVYKVWDAQRATYLAMKLLREDLAQDRVFLRRFKREAETLSRLQHPSIVRFYGLERDGLVAFMLMDYVEGTSLRTEIFQSEGSPMPVRRIREVMRPICSALHYAHSQGMIHCDIKPGNILIDQTGRVLVSDFGIARMTDGATATMVGMGTPAYMAPEQVLGQAPLPQTDIYALGVVLYEMLTGGERPFTGERAKTTGSTSEKVRWEQLKLKPPSPRKHNPDISPELEAVVLRCLDKEPEERFPAPLDVLNALERSMGGGETAAPPRTAQAKPVPLAEAPAVDDALPVRHEKPLLVQPAAPAVREDPVAPHPPTREPAAPATRKPRQRRAQPAQRQHPSPYTITIPKTVWMGGVYLLVAGIVVGLLALLGVFGGGTGRTSVVPTEKPVAVVAEATATKVPTQEPTATNIPTSVPDLAPPGLRSAEWPMYGHDPAHTFWNQMENDLRPPLQVAWTTNLQGIYPEHPIVANGMVYVTGMDDSGLNRMDGLTTDGAWQWKHLLPEGGGAMGHAVAYLDGLIFAGGQGEPSLYGLDGGSGQEVWKITDAEGMYASPPLVIEDMVYMYAYEDLYAVKAATGLVGWQISGAGWGGSLAVWGNTLAATSFQTYPMGVSLDSGTILWERRDLPTYFVDLIAYDGLVYLGGDHKIWALSIEDGATEWVTPFPYDYDDSDMDGYTFALADGVLYAAGGSDPTDEKPDPRNGLLALDARTGEALWQQEPAAHWYRPVVANGILYVNHTYQGLSEIIMLAAATGEKLGSLDLPAFTDIVIADGYLYVCYKDYGSGTSYVEAYQSQ